METRRRASADPIWRILRHQGRTQAWLAERTEYSEIRVKQFKSGIAPITAKFRQRCASALDLPEDVLFLCRECSSVGMNEESASDEKGGLDAESA